MPCRQRRPRTVPATLGRPRALEPAKCSGVTTSDVSSAGPASLPTDNGQGRPVTRSVGRPGLRGVRGQRGPTSRRLPAREITTLRQKTPPL